METLLSRCNAQAGLHVIERPPASAPSASFSVPAPLSLSGFLPVSPAIIVFLGLLFLASPSHAPAGRRTFIFGKPRADRRAIRWTSRNGTSFRVCRRRVFRVRDFFEADAINFPVSLKRVQARQTRLFVAIRSFEETVIAQTCVLAAERS